MTSYYPILLIVLIAGLFHTAVSLKFTSTPADQVVIVGHNNSNIELVWRLNLTEKTFDRARIYESPTNSFNGISPLYFSSRSPQILAEHQDRVNVTLVADNGIVTLTFVIHNVTQSDKIYYQVLIEDSDGIRNPDVLVINVYVFPGVQLYSDQTTYYENQTITLHCNATGKPTPTISWKQMNHPSRSFPTGSNLIIATANETDGGEYKCIGTNSIGSDEASLNITVIPFSVPVIEFLSSNQADVIGSTIVLHCNASGFPSPSITWTKQGNDSILSTSSNLILNQATTEDAGLYTCTATNHEGNDTRTVFVDVQFAPEISRHPQSMIVNESNSISLFCNASGNPSPKITWTKEGDANFKSANNFLHLTNVSKSDGGIYICNASNGIGQNATANATVTIQYKPQGTVIQSNLTNNLVVRPEGVKINCTADANPAPNLYEFVSNNNKVGESSNGIFELSSTNLSFQNTIKCIPYNRYWVGQAAELVIVVHVEPEIVTSPLSGVYNESTSVSLFCNATGNPSPNITWTKAGDSLFTHTGNTLTLINVWKNNTGTYVCTASNGIGNADTRNGSVIVQYAPVETVLGSNTTNNTIARPGVISFNCSTDSHPRPLSYEFFKDNTSVESNTDGIFVISSEYLSYQATFSCVPKNVLGQGQKAELDVTVYVAPKIASHTKNITITEGDSAVLFCNASGNPLPEISWKKIPGFISSGKELELINATKENSGTYVCTTSNGIGDDASVSILVTVLFSPAIVHISPNQSVIETNSITLFCNASGNPIPNITWTKIDDSGFRYDGSKLTINDTSKNNTGVYRCTASNGIRGTASSSTSLNVQYIPRSTTLQVSVSNNIAIHPDKVDFLCETDANPPATSFQFYHNGQLEANESTGVYVLQQTQISDSGTYSCVPKNLLGNGEKAEMNLTIHYEPNITRATSAAETWMNKEVTIQCTAEGNPRPNITWSRGSGTVGIIDTYTVQSTLRVNPTTMSDFGAYTCTANNGVGTALKNISLTQQLVPGTPIIQKTELVENKMTVRWTAPLNNGGHEIRSYEVSFSDGSGTKTCRTAANRTSCVFDTVLTLKEYSVSIKCENGVGFSNEVKVNMEVKRINMVFPAEPCDVETTTPGGKRYKEIVDAFLAEIDRVYSKSSTKLYGLSVDSLRCGSIIAVFKMSFLKNDTNYLEPLKKETANGKLGTFTVDKDSIKEYEEPVEEAGFTKFWNSLPLGAKIGLIIAFVLFLFLIVYMIVMCVIKCRQNKKSGNFGDDFAMKNYSNKAFSTDTENGLVMTKEKELQYADLAEFRSNDTQGEKLNKPTTNQPTDYAEITHFQKPPQEENNRQNGHSKQDMQTGEKRTDKNEAGSGKTTNNTAKPAYNMETISNDPGIKNNTYIPRARRWHNDDFLY